MPSVIAGSEITARPASNKALDAGAVRAIAQAAINVELFTIPLYMGSLYSIWGMHQITGANTFYLGRQWPGAATTAKPSTANEQAFNLVFSVFIEEMLHLQIASNLASAVGATPVFTSPALQSADHGWTCYGAQKTIIPHIVDLQDTVPYDDVKVKIAALTAEQLKLFLAIEQPEEQARGGMKKKRKHPYFPKVPFDGWTVKKTEADLPMFGTIGWMYDCYYTYLKTAYDDGTTLWDYMFVGGGQQNDMFNYETPGKGSSHPMREYPGFDAALPASDAQAGFARAVAMMSAITDQGEGREVKPVPDLLAAVQKQYQASCDALEADYPNYDAQGKTAPSADAPARFDNGGLDHYERFEKLKNELIGQVVTWPDWFARGEVWRPQDLEVSTDGKNAYPLPAAKDIADALNRVGARDDRGRRLKNQRLMSQVVVGAIAGITGVLDDYWRKQAGGSPVSFPYPSMVGSGDRMAIYWALFGEAPDLSQGSGGVDPNTLYHSCQGLDLAKVGADCAAPAVFHSCRGSNHCKAQGGCGFVQATTGGGRCGFSVVAAKASCGGPTPAPSDGRFSAPSDNKCATFGGCAVPISASQLLAKSGTMTLFDFEGADSTPVPLSEPLSFQEGESVHDIAFKAYQMVMAHRGKTPPANPPAPNDLRLIFPPST